MEYRSPKREREHHAELDEIGSTIDQQIMFTRILYTVGHMYTVNDKRDNIQLRRASIARIYRVMPICQRVHPIV